MRFLFYKNKISYFIVKTTHGFTLVEVLVSMGVFSIGLLSIVTLQLQAQAAIGDSLLKNYAVIFASSRHEIHQLEAQDGASAEILSSKWMSQTQKKLPDVQVETTAIGSLSFIVSLFWTNNQSTSGCVFKKEKNIDCLQL